MNDALAFNPRALISLIQTGFIVDASAIKCSIETNRHVSGPLNLIHMKYISILHASGFLMEFDVLPQRSSTSKYGNLVFHKIVIALFMILMFRVQNLHAEGAKPT